MLGSEVDVDLGCAEAVLLWEALELSDGRLRSLLQNRHQVAANDVKFYVARRCVFPRGQARVAAFSRVEDEDESTSEPVGLRVVVSSSWAISLCSGVSELMIQPSTLVAFSLR